MTNVWPLGRHLFCVRSSLFECPHFHRKQMNAAVGLEYISSGGLFVCLFVCLFLSFVTGNGLNTIVMISWNI